MEATPLHSLADLLGGNPYTVAAALMSSSLAAFTAMYKSDSPDVRSLVLLVPQQFFMLIAAGGSVQAMVTATYADGVIRPMTFIIADQMPWVLGAIFYTLAITEHFGRRLWKATG
jgi:uncharacterized membrane protein